MASGLERRKHGDIFPLPHRALVDDAFQRGVFPQRAGWIGAALSKLALHEELNSSRTRAVLNSDLPLTAAQQRW